MFINYAQNLFHILENSLILESLLGQFYPLVCFILANETKMFGHNIIRETCSLCLCQYMTTTSKICDKSLPLLFTALEKEKSSIVRTSTIIALGDLAFRFPNSVEPWIDRIYSRLAFSFQYY
jgi:condensin complex subunit 1